MQKYIKNTALVIVSVYVAFAGLSIVTVVLDWSSWENVKDWLVKGLAIAAVFFVINVVIALLTNLLPHSSAPAKKK